VGLRIGGEIDGEFKGGETGSSEKERRSRDWKEKMEIADLQIRLAS
jgi:hypothetical protein